MIGGKAWHWPCAWWCALALAGCTTTERPMGPSRQITAKLELVSGAGQQGLYGGRLEEQLVVRVSDEAGQGVGGVQVTWTTASGGGRVCVPTAAYPGALTCWLGTADLTTDGQGLSSVWFYPGRLGEDDLTASAAGLVGSVVFPTSTNGILITISPIFDCGDGNDPMEFYGPEGSNRTTGLVGHSVVWTLADWLDPSCVSGVASISGPGEAFASPVLHPGDRFELVPAAPGTWKVREISSGSLGTLAVVTGEQ